MSLVEDRVRGWLARITGVTCFPEKMKIYAPTCYDKCLPEVERLINRVNQIFGGSTVYDAQGSWVSDGRVETEPVKVIEVGHRCASLKEARELAEAIVEYARDAKQNYISIHQGDFYIARSEEMLRAYENLKRQLPITAFLHTQNKEKKRS
jgi:predicted Zn-dependent protease